MDLTILKSAKATKTPTPAPIMKIKRNLLMFIPFSMTCSARTLTSGSAMVATMPKMNEKKRITANFENLLTESPTYAPIFMTEPSIPEKNKTSPTTMIARDKTNFQRRFESKAEKERCKTKTTNKIGRTPNPTSLNFDNKYFIQKLSPINRTNNVSIKLSFVFSTWFSVCLSFNSC